MKYPWDRVWEDDLAVLAKTALVVRAKERCGGAREEDVDDRVVERKIGVEKAMETDGGRFVACGHQN